MKTNNQDWCTSFVNFYLKDNVDDDVLLYFFLTHPYQWQTELSEYLDCNQTPRKIILANSSESPHVSVWEETIDFLERRGIDRSRIMTVDAGLDRFPNLNHHYAPTFPLMADQCEISQFQPKSKLFVSLSRMARVYRVLFTEHLLKRNLDKHGLISCGAASDDVWEYNYDLVSSEFRHRFPLLIDGSVSRSSAFCSGNEQFYQCLINVVVESNYENQIFMRYNKLQVLNNSGTRPFFTEKSAKFVSWRQIPIFVSTMGYVAWCRKIGLDVFDDIVDHSYDTEPDPFVRLSLVANELERLSHYDVMGIISTASLEIRTQKNIESLRRFGHLKQEELQESISKFLK